MSAILEYDWMVAIFKFCYHFLINACCHFEYSYQRTIEIGVNLTFKTTILQHVY